MVNTVLGPMETSEMGRTLMHEHAVCFDIALKKAFGKKWVDEDAAIELIVKELKAAKEYSGIQTIVAAKILTPDSSDTCFRIFTSRPLLIGVASTIV